MKGNWVISSNYTLTRASKSHSTEQFSSKKQQWKNNHKVLKDVDLYSSKKHQVWERESIQSRHTSTPALLLLTADSCRALPERHPAYHKRAGEYELWPSPPPPPALIDLSFFFKLFHPACTLFLIFFSILWRSLEGISLHLWHCFNCCQLEIVSFYMWLVLFVT